jgi:hypothetical protein
MNTAIGMRYAATRMNGNSRNPVGIKLVACPQTLGKKAVVVNRKIIDSNTDSPR